MKTERQPLTLDDVRLVRQGREAEIFAWPGGRVLRSRRKEGPLASIAVELSAVETAGCGGGRVPCMYEQIVIDGRPGGEPPPGTSLPLRILAKVECKLLIAAYVRSYKRHAGHPLDHKQLRRWEIVNLAASLVEGIRGERPRLLRRLRKELARDNRS